MSESLDCFARLLDYEALLVCRVRRLIRRLICPKTRTTGATTARPVEMACLHVLMITCWIYLVGHRWVL